MIYRDIKVTYSKVGHGVEHRLTLGEFYAGALARSWSAEPSGAGEHQPNTCERHADQLSRLQRQGFGSQKSETVDERRGDGDNEKVDKKCLRRAEPRGHEGEAHNDKRPKRASSNDFHALSHDKARIRKRKAVDHRRDQDQNQGGDAGGYRANPDRLDARPHR
jgi:hypothetical protein